MKKYLMLSAFAVLLLSACSKDNSVVPTVDEDDTSIESLERRRGKKNFRPFRGNLYYQFSTNQDLPCDCGELYPVGTFEGVGRLTHFGNTTSLIKPCVSPLFEDGVQVGEYVGVECAYFEAANGDIAYLYTHPYNLLYTPGGAVGTATVDFVGGTGRFKRAKGQFTGTVTVLGATASFTNLKGRIRY